jgi:cell division protein FtsW
MQKFLSYLKGDRVIWMVALFLCTLSVLAVYSAVSSLVWKAEGGSSAGVLIKHISMLGLGMAFMYITHLLPLTFFSRIGQVMIWVVIPLLVFTLFFGSNINNADRWIRIPGIGLTFQTSDLAKLVLIIYVARQLTVKRQMLDDFKKGVLPIVIPIAIVCALVLPANFSTAALIGFVCFLMLVFGGVPWKHLFKLIAVGVGLIVLIIGIGELGPEKLLPRYSTWKNRLVGKEVQAGAIDDSKYQIELAQYAIYEGGIIPKGPGSGTSRNFLPHPYSDMIYAFIIEEYGSILGGALVMLMYVIFLFRVIRISIRSPKYFGGLTALGLGLVISIQAFINMGVAVNLFPTTGQPLPLVSMGGTSIVFVAIMFGVILSISKMDEENADVDQNDELEEAPF